MDPVFFLFGGFKCVFIPVICILSIFGEFFGSLLLFRKLVLALTQLRLRLLHALSHVLPEVNISDSLLHHKVHRVDRVLNVVRLGPEQVSDRWHTVALLCLPNIFEIVHETGNLHLLLIFGVI